MTPTRTPLRVGNPYVGPTAFRLGDELYGRDHEREDLLDLLVAERIVLLYSPSGAGKTSLIQAALLPALHDEGFEVMPVIRVTHLPGPHARLPAPRNRYVTSVLLSLEEGVPPEQQRTVAELATLTLGEYLEAHTDRDGRRGNEVLIFDQFEEVLTADPTDEPAKHEFFRELGQVLRNRGHWALFSMREDFLAALDPYLAHLPTRLRTTYRLDLLSEAEALEAMRRPAEEAGIHFQQEAAQQLVDDLRTVRVQRPTGVTEVLGSYVEPVQLQVACHLLWTMLPPDATEITQADVDSLGRVDQALADYYADRVRFAAEQTGVPERVIREWFEERLITPQGLRSQVLQGPEPTTEDGHRVLGELLDAHLVRAETRRQATWYELAHDRLIEPVRRDNAAWRAEHLSSFERAAALWEHEGKPHRLLVLGADLVAAEQDDVVRTDALTSRQREFLQASRQADEQLRKEQRTAAVLRRSARRLRIAVAVMTLLAVAAGFFLFQSREAQRQTQSQETMYRLLSGAQRNLDWDQQLSVSLAAAATRAMEPGDVDGPILDVLYRVASTAPVSMRFHGQGPATAAVVSADGSAVVTADSGGLQLWDRASGDPQERLELRDGDSVTALVTNRDARTVVAELQDETVLTWHVESGRSERWTVDAGIYTLTVSPDGSRLAVIDAAEATSVWRVDGGSSAPAAPEFEIPRSGFALTWDVAFSADGRRLVILTDGAAVITDVASRREVGRVQLADNGATRLALSPDLTSLATMDAQTVRFWDVATGVPLTPPLEDPDATYRNVSRDFSRVLSVYAWGEVGVWDAASGTFIALVSVPGAAIGSATFDPSDPDQILVVQAEADPVFWRTRPAVGGGTGLSTLAVSSGERVFSIFGDGTVRSWDVHGRQSIVPRLDGTTISALAAEPSGRLLAGVVAGAAYVWDVRTGTAVVTLQSGDDWFTDIALTPDGAQLVTVASDGRVVRWDARTGEELGELAGPHDNGGGQLFVSPDGSRVVSLMPPPVSTERGDIPDQLALVLSLRDQARPVAIRLSRGQGGEADGAAPDQLTRGAFDSSGSRIFLGTSSGRVAAFDTSTGEALWEEVPHQKDVRDVVVGPGGELLTTDGDRQALILDPGTGETLQRIPSQFDLVSAAFSTDGRQIAPVATGSALYAVPLDDDALVEQVQSRVVRDLTAENCVVYGIEPPC